MKKIIIGIALFSTLLFSPAFADAPFTPPLQFVKLYVDQLNSIENIRDAAEKENETSDTSQKMADCVHTMTQYQLVLATGISAMKDVHLDKPMDAFPQGLIDFYQQKLDLYKQYGDTCSAMMAGPKPGVDYAKMTTALPKVRAELEYLDEGIFKMAPAVFGSLILMKENSHGGADHLVITKAERDALVQEIRTDFGAKLKQKNANWTVSAASVLEFYLTKKGYKCSDEPWN